MTPKKSSNKQAARARSIPRRPRSAEGRAELGTADANDANDANDEDEEEGDTDGEADNRSEDDGSREPDEVTSTPVARKRKPTRGSVPLPPPTPQRVAREGEEDDLPDEVLEFVRAIDAYKRAKQRQFPSWSEVLEVLKQLGYERRAS